jgi:hypothetical protein
MNSPQNQFQVSTGSIQFTAPCSIPEVKEALPVDWAGLFAKERETWSLRDCVGELYSTLLKDQ